MKEFLLMIIATCLFFITVSTIDIRWELRELNINLKTLNQIKTKA